MSEDIWFVYILQSTVTGNLYTGISNNPTKRLKAHNSGKGAKYTRSNGPWVMRFLERVGPKGDALRRERVIKKLGRARKLKLIQVHERGSEHLPDCSAQPCPGEPSPLEPSQ